MKDVVIGNFACFGKEYAQQLRTDSDTSKDFGEFICKRSAGGHFVPPQYRHYLNNKQQASGISHR